jgi:hypothetical protein
VAEIRQATRSAFQAQLTKQKNLSNKTLNNDQNVALKTVIRLMLPASAGT